MCSFYSFYAHCLTRTDVSFYPPGDGEGSGSGGVRPLAPSAVGEKRVRTDAHASASTTATTTTAGPTKKLAWQGQSHQQQQSRRASFGEASDKAAPASRSASHQVGPGRKGRESMLRVGQHLAQGGGTLKSVHAVKATKFAVPSRVRATGVATAATAAAASGDEEGTGAIDSDDEGYYSVTSVGELDKTFDPEEEEDDDDSDYEEEPRRGGGAGRRGRAGEFASE